MTINETKNFKKTRSKWNPTMTSLLPKRINDDRADKSMTEAAEIIYELIEILKTRQHQLKEDYEKAS